MNAKIQVEKPDKIEMTLTITMPLGDWKKLNDQLQDVWPACDFRDAIHAMTNKATKYFLPES